MSRPLAYTHELDGLRGVAIFMVLFSHVGVLKGGFIGVDLFFVLSGFLITRLLLQEYDASNGTIAMGNFYMRRLLRLGPALLLLLSVYCLLGLLAGSDPLSYVWRALIALFYVSNWVQAFDLYPMIQLSHTWSLSIEEQFYLAWPLLILVLLRKTRSREQLAALIAVAIVAETALRMIMVQQGLPWYRIHLGLDAHADPLLVGCLLGVVLSSPQLHARCERHASLIRRGALAACVFLLAQQVMLEPFEVRVRQYHLWGMALTSIATGLVLLHIFTDQASSLKRFLAWRPLVAAGKVSYGLYLWHYPVFDGVGMLLKAYPLSPVVVLLLVIPALFALTWLVAWASFRFVEAPVLRLKHRYAAKGVATPG